MTIKSAYITCMVLTNSEAADDHYGHVTTSMFPVVTQQLISLLKTPFA